MKENPKSVQKDKFQALAEEYAKSYPGNGAFHITSDRLVFLEGELPLAEAHQKSADATKKVRTINVK